MGETAWDRAEREKRERESRKPEMLFGRISDLIQGTDPRTLEEKLAEAMFIMKCERATTCMNIAVQIFVAGVGHPINPSDAVALAGRIQEHVEILHGPGCNEARDRVFELRRKRETGK